MIAEPGVSCAAGMPGCCRTEDHRHDLVVGPAPIARRDGLTRRRCVCGGQLFVEALTDLVCMSCGRRTYGERPLTTPDGRLARPRLR